MIGRIPSATSNPPHTLRILNRSAHEQFQGSELMTSKIESTHMRGRTAKRQRLGEDSGRTHSHRKRPRAGHAHGGGRPRADDKARKSGGGQRHSEDMTQWVLNLFLEERNERQREVGFLRAELAMVAQQRFADTVTVAPDEADAHSSTRPGLEGKARPSPPVDHPLARFISDRLECRPWLRAPCGKVARAYKRWSRDNGNDDKLNHIAFAREMNMFFERTGCESRQKYVGLAVKPDDPEPPVTLLDSPPAGRDSDEEDSDIGSDPDPVSSPIATTGDRILSESE